MINNVKIELCANSLDDILIASKYPFDTIELNSGAEVDGLTPSLAFFQRAKKLTDAKMEIMIRPRAGGFHYSKELYEQMKDDLKLFMEAGADGAVFGFTDLDQNIDKEKTREFIEIIHSYGKTATFHKAIDVIKNNDEALDYLKNLKIDRILTTPDNVLKIKSKYPEIDVIGGGGVNSGNISSLINSKITHLHFSAKKTIKDCFGSYFQADEAELQNIIKCIEDTKDKG